MPLYPTVTQIYRLCTLLVFLAADPAATAVGATQATALVMGCPPYTQNIICVATDIDAARSTADDPNHYRIGEELPSCAMLPSGKLAIKATAGHHIVIDEYEEPIKP